MPKPAPKKNDHPILEAAEVSKKASGRLLKELSFCVPWEHFAGALGVEEFEEYKLVAMADLWSGAGHDPVLGAAGISKTRATKIRKAEYYAAIKDALEAAMLESTRSFTDKDWIEKGRSVAWRRIYQDAAFGADKERAIAAARDFTDRTSPKATRAEGGTDRVVYIPDGLVELLSTAMKESKMIEGEVEVVDVTPDED